jgi:TolB protein
MESTPRTFRTHAALSRSAIAVVLLALTTLFAPPARAQDNILTGTSSGVTSIRIAVADFKPLAADPQTAAFKQTFDTTLYADLASAGIFDIVSKSLMPPGEPGAPAEVQLQSYSNAPASAAMLVFGSLGQAGGKLVVNGFLFDAKNLQYPQVLAKSTAKPPPKTPPARSPTASPTRSSTASAVESPASPKPKSTTSR